VLLPSASVFLLLLCNDPEVLGPWVNRPWLNALASLIIGILLVMSLILIVTTVFPHVDVARLSVVLGGLLLGALATGGGATALARSRRPPPVSPVARGHRDSWRMPPLALLGRPPWSSVRVWTMRALSGYLVLAVLLLIVKAVQLGGA